MDLHAPPPSQRRFDELSDDERYTALDAAALYRDAKRQALSPVAPGKNEAGTPDPCAAPPEAHTPDWQIMQSGAIITKFYMELCRRDPSLLEREK